MTARGCEGVRVDLKEAIFTCSAAAKMESWKERRVTEAEAILIEVKKLAAKACLASTASEQAADTSEAYMEAAGNSESAVACMHHTHPEKIRKECLDYSEAIKDDRRYVSDVLEEMKEILDKVMQALKETEVLKADVAAFYKESLRNKIKFEENLRRQAYTPFGPWDLSFHHGVQAISKNKN